MAAPRTPRPRVLTGTPAEHGYSFPAEWQPHAATWISWPRPEGISFPGFYHRSIRDVVRVVKAITEFEPVHLNVPNENYVRIVRDTLREGGVPLARVVLHQIRTNECWTRDHGPAFVQRTRRGTTETAIVDWGFNAWGGKYPPWDADDEVPTKVACELSLPVFNADIVMEGGAVDFNGEGTILTTTSCLLNRNRNPQCSRNEIEGLLKAYYGQRHVIWLGEGIEGDDTDGHVDDLARFIDARTIVTS
ncbi:MAG: agmatine deiminase family protein, partial [Vicinamibacterales bacterium]